MNIESFRVSRYALATGLLYILGVSGALPAPAYGASPAIADAASDHADAPVQADQQTSDTDAVGVEDVVVTAQGRTQRLQDVPISASVTSGRQLEDANLHNLEDVAVRLPNVRIAQAPISDFINVRGVGSSLNLGFEQSVATFVDGVYRGRSRSTRAALFDVERVEILKGPQTTFFGNNAIAGALNITTRKPDNNFAANASAFYAPNLGQYSLEGGVTVPLTETLAVRVAGRASGMDGYIKNTQLDDEGPHVRDAIGRISVAWTPDDAVKIEGRFDIGRTRTRGQFDTELTGCPPPPVFGQPVGACARALNAQGSGLDDRLDRQSQANPSFFNYNYREGELTATVKLGENRLRFTSGYFHHDYDQATDVIPIAANAGGSVVGEPFASVLKLNERYEQFSQEVRLESPDRGFFSYLIGAYYLHGKLDFDNYQGMYFVPFGNFSGGEYTGATPIALSIGNHERDETKSVFAAITLRPVDKLRINLGLRYTDVQKRAARDARFGTVMAGQPIPGPTNFLPGSTITQNNLFSALGVDQGDFVRPSRSDNKLLPTGSIQYDIAPDFMVYASYSKGFKAGGYSVLFSKADFDPETVDAFELGSKASLLDDRLKVNLALFHSKYNNLQETTTITLPSGAAGAVVGNVAASTSKGIELGTTLAMSPALTFNLDVAYLDARYDSYPAAPCTVLQGIGQPFCSQDLSGKRRAFAPKFSGNFGTTFKAPLTDSLGLSVGGNVYFSSRFYQQPLADTYQEQRGYAKIDARVAISGSQDKWEIAIIGKNLTNKLTASYRQQVPTAIGSYQVLADPPRSVGLQARIRY